MKTIFPSAHRDSQVPLSRRRYCADFSDLAQQAFDLGQLFVQDVFRKNADPEPWDTDLALELAIGFLEQAAERLRKARPIELGQEKTPRH